MGALPPGRKSDALRMGMRRVSSIEVTQLWQVKSAEYTCGKPLFNIAHFWPGSAETGVQARPDRFLQSSPVWP